MLLRSSPLSTSERNESARFSGLFMMFFGLGTSSGGLVAGAIYDQTHRYSAAFTVDLLSCILAFILFFAVGRRPAPRPAPLATALKKTA